MVFRLLYDFYMFVNMLLYWVAVAVLMYPLHLIDRRLGTRLNAPLVRLTKIIGNL